VLVLGIESSCDESGVALFDSASGLLAHRLHSQVALHDAYGGVVPELASRDHVRRITPLLRAVLLQANRQLKDIDAIAYTRGPGLAGALLVGASIAQSLAHGLGIPAIGIHHLEGHLLSPLLANPAPEFPFTALLVSGGHTQLMDVTGVGQYRLLGETVDDAAGEAFDKTAKLLNLPYPGGPALAKLAESGTPGRFKFPRPMMDADNFNFSFSGLKTAVVLAKRASPDEVQMHADIAAEFQEAVVEVLSRKCVRAMDMSESNTLVVAGGVGANTRLRTALDTAALKHGFKVFYPPLEFCTDNGAMIALAGALRLQRESAQEKSASFDVRPRWALSSVSL
jgi:N6-L-threonylcarbamoyladenine synthase